MSLVVNNCYHLRLFILTCMYLANVLLRGSRGSNPIQVHKTMTSYPQEMY